jgi:hypothetical protein
MDIFKIKGMKCHDAVALTCDDTNPSVSLTCKPNASLKTVELNPDRCYCDEGFYLDEQLQSCGACSGSCTSGLCTGPLVSDCVELGIQVKSIPESTGLGYFFDQAFNLEGFVDFHGNEG